MAEIDTNFFQNDYDNEDTHVINMLFMYLYFVVAYFSRKKLQIEALIVPYDTAQWVDALHVDAFNDTSQNKLWLVCTSVRRANRSDQTGNGIDR